MQILRSVGGRFRLIGSLALANGLINPGFELGATGWDVLDSNDEGLVTITADTSTAQFDTTSCRIDVASGSSAGNYYGISQTLLDVPSPGQDYTLSLWINIQTDLPSSGGVFTVPMARIYYTDENSSLLATHEGQLTVGTATDWTKVSFTETAVPDNTAGAIVAVAASPAGTGTPAFSFNIDGLVWSAGDANEYVDGDFAGYLWSGDRFLSTTLSSVAPDALASFQDGTPQFVVL